MNRKGFSLIELLTVVGIIGILASIGLVTYNSYIWSTKKTSAKNIIQQMSLAQTEHISNNGSYFESTDECSAIATSTQTTEINDELLKSETIEPGKLRFNMCVRDTSTDDTLGYDYAIIATAVDAEGELLCRLEFHSNGSWVDDTGPDC